MANESLKKLIENMNTNKKIKVMPIIRENPDIAAFISKLIKPRDKTGFDLNKKNNDSILNQNQLMNITENTKNKIKDNDNLLTLFPDIELAIQILVSSILSPKDMVKTEIIYRLKNSILPSEISLMLNTLVEDNLRNHYKIDEECPDILRETLFTSGCYIKAIIPENSIDEIINENSYVSTESLKDLFVKKDQSNDFQSVNIGILGNSSSSNKLLALEKFSLDIPIINYNSSITYKSNNKEISLENILDITDNYNFLKLPKVNEVINKQKIKHIIKTVNKKVSLENKNSVTNISNLLYKENYSSTSQFVSIPTINKAKRKAIGRPMVIKIPAEATIPVYNPGDETKHVGYFVLLDIDGNPITKNTNNDYMTGLSGILNGNNQNNDLTSMLIQKAKNNLMGTAANSMPTIDQLTKIYGNIVETDLVERLKNGIYKQDLSIAENEDIYRIMLARAFANKYTRIIFIPVELVTYFAFNYHENGTGKSYLDDLKILTSLRALLLFSKVMSMVKSAINVTHVNVTLDPNDPDPQNTIELAAHEIIKMRQQYFPLGINSPTDLVDWIQRAGFEFSFEGHPGLPQTKLDFDLKNMQHTMPDSDLDESLRKQTYMSFGLSPETVDNGFNSEFATTVVSNNILLSKRVIQLQNKFTNLLTDYAKKIMTNDMKIKDEIKKIIKENKGNIEKILTDEEKELLTNDENSFYDIFTDNYIDTIYLDLPKPDETSLETQTSAFDNYVEAIDKTIDHWLSSDLINNEISGEVNAYIDGIKIMIKSYFIRRWMADNNYMPELSEIVTTDDNDKPSLDLYEINKSHIEGITRSTIKFLDSLKGSKNAANADLEKINNGEVPEATGGEETPDNTGGEATAGDTDLGIDGF